ncbi:MAG: hypothetical protein ACRDOK_29060 [Streptosporangiaceae bacterium]
MTSQPEPQWGWPGGAGSDQGPGAPGAVSAIGRPRAGPTGRGGRAGLRGVVISLLLVVGLAGLAAAAVGITHRLLPRQFTPAQQRQIIGWEMQRRWRVLSAGKIFPAAVAYTVSAGALGGPGGLTLQAQRLGISPPESCSAAVSAAAASVLERSGCTTVLRATYVDSSGSMVATVVVAVLPTGTAASKVVPDLTSAAGAAPGPVQTFAVPGTAAAGFGDGERQLSEVDAAGPYVILATAGFTDDRREQVSADDYVRAEMTSLAHGLISSAQQVLGKQPAPPVCPGARGC